MRDLEADLKICEAATPGPWHRIERRVGRDNYLVDAEIVGNRIYWYGQLVSSTSVCKLCSGFIYFEGDIAFIEASRAGWPETIRELMDARKKIEELETALQQEREACARIAEQSFDVYNVGNCIASDIRNRNK